MDETSLTTEVGLELLDYAVILLYMVLTFGIAVWFGRQQKDTDDFFVGGRRMPWFAVGLSILATLFSTLSYLGGPGEMIKNGIGLLVGNFAHPFSIAVIFFLWIPFFMRLRVTSAYEYLEHRFSYPVRLIGAFLFVLLRLGWMSMVVYAASLALNSVKGPDSTLLPGPDIFWWIAGVGVFAAIYTSVGGIQAMIWTDVLQCILLLTGVLMAIFYVILVDHTGPLDWWATATEHRPNHTSLPLFTWDVTVRNTVTWVIVGNFFWTICTHGSDQVVLQRYFSTASPKAARRSYLMNVAVDLTMSVLLSLCGLALLAFYLKHPDRLPADERTAMGAADKLFPHFLGHQLPTGCAGLIIAAFLCDAMQTLESGVNSITAVFTNDVLPRLRQGHKRILSDLSVARLLTLIITGIVTTNACFVAYRTESAKAEAIRVEAAMTPAEKAEAAKSPQVRRPTLIDLMPKFFNMFVGPLAGLFVIGMFLSRCTTRSAIPAVIAGISVSVCWSWFREIFGTDYGPTPFLAIAVPWLTTVGTGLLLGLVIERGGFHPGKNYTWFAVVKRPAINDAEGTTSEGPTPEGATV